MGRLPSRVLWLDMLLVAFAFSGCGGGSTSVSLVFGATTNAAIGNFSVTAQGSSGALSHLQTLALTVQAGVVPMLPRTAYARTDSVATADAPLGEPHRRHIAYDPANKQVFVANRAMNRVEVFSTSNQTRITQISVPWATSADLSADGATVWIGTGRNEIVAVDPVSLTVKNRYAPAGLTPIPNTIFDRPVEVLSLSNAKAMVRLRQPNSAEALPALWDPASNSLSDLTASAPAVFQQGVGVLARSGDHSKVLAAANDSNGEVALFDSGGSAVAGPITIGTGIIPWVAANNDGSRFAVVFVGGSNAQVLLLNALLQQASAYLAANVSGATFSRDGKELYVAETSSGASFITVLDGQSGQLLGRVPDIPIQGVASMIEDADETQLLFALSNRGFSFIDASTLGAISLAAPIVAAAPSVQPSEGPIAGGTSTVLNGQNFAGLAQVKFGSQLAANPTVSSSQVKVASPSSVVNGAVNLTAYFQNSWLALAPDAFSYGPLVLPVLLNVGSRSGGDSVQIYGYGFGTDPTKINVKIGGAAAIVQKVENVTTVVPSLALDATYPFPIERITLQTPSGSPGKADILIATPTGTTVSSKSFQYLHGVQSYPKPASFKFLIYDQPRQRIYLSNIDRVDVFDLQQNLLEKIPGRVSVPGMVLHPSGALLYQPFLTGAPGSTGVKGGVDIFDAHSGALRLRIFLPQQFMTEIDGLHGSFLATDENGQRLFAITSLDGTPQNAALTIVQLAVVPLRIGTIQPSTVSAAGGATLTIRGSGFVNGVGLTFNGKAATVTFKDANTLSVTVPALAAGPQRITITNPDGESVSLDAAITAN